MHTPTLFLPSFLPRFTPTSSKALARGILPCAGSRGRSSPQGWPGRGSVVRPSLLCHPPSMCPVPEEGAEALGSVWVSPLMCSLFGRLILQLQTF